MASAYTEAWQPWDDRLADHVIAKRNWQLAFGAMTIVALALVVAVVWLASRIRYVVYAVEVDKLGYALALAQPLTPTTGPANEMIARMERFEVAEYIRDTRSVSSDPKVEQQDLNSILAHTVHLSAADNFLNQYFHADHAAKNPFVIALHHTVTVQIESILPLSAKTWQVRWQENACDLHGALLGSPTYWEAELQTELITPKGNDSIVSNPLGFFVTQIAWTEQANQ
jgi:type IV secretory pathway TrbF-like protein